MIQRLLAAAFLATFASMAMALEEPQYEVLLTSDDYEIRRYAEYIVAEVDISGDMSDAGNSAFRILAGYIFGDNAAEEKMSMTAPVESQPAIDSVRMNKTAAVESRQSVAAGDSSTYAFVMERKYTMETLPKPADPRVRLTNRPARTMAVRRYSGGWSEAKYEKHRDELLAALRAAQVEVVDGPVWARYNSPFTPWFLRRNEVMFEVAGQESAIRPAN